MSEQLKQQQKTQWAAAAPGWDKHFAALEQHVKVVATWMSDAIRVGPGNVVLDVACGSGEPSMTIAQRVKPGGRVIATDLTPEMVAATRRRHDAAGNKHVETKIMDAEAIEFADGAFDAVTCRFGLMFCPDPVRAATEIHRVLKPGGRFALAVWDEPARNPFFTVIGQVIAKHLGGPPPDPTAPGPFRLAPPGELAKVLTAAKLGEIRVEPMPLSFKYGSPEEFWEIQSELAAPLRAAISTQPKDKIDAIRSDVIAAASQHRVDGVISLLATPLVAVAMR